MDPTTVWQALRTPDVTDGGHAIVRLMRVPRLAVALVAGAGLAVAGTLIQALTRNPLAEPGLLGINSGAAAAVALGLVAAPSAPPPVILALAFAGAAAAGVLVLFLGGALSARPDPVRLVLAGAAVTAVLGAFTSFLLINVPRVFDTFRYWDAGAVTPRDGALVGTAAVVVAVGVVAAFAVARAVNVLGLGDEMGAALGLSRGRTWLLAGATALLMAGTATALTGPIGLLGLMAPMFARWITGPDHRRILPLAVVLGMTILVVADVLGRVLAPPAEIQAAIVCALLGAPVFVALARRSTLVGL